MVGVIPGGKSFLARRVSSLSGGVNFTAPGYTLKPCPDATTAAIRTTTAAPARLNLFMGPLLSVSKCDGKNCDVGQPRAAKCCLHPNRHNQTFIDALQKQN